jgi:hypothetical protein
MWRCAMNEMYGDLTPRPPTPFRWPVGSRAELNGPLLPRRRRGQSSAQSSRELIEAHPLIVETLAKWRAERPFRKPDAWVFASGLRNGRKPYWGQAIMRKHIRPLAQELGIEKRIGWHTFRHSYSTLLRSVCTEFKVTHLGLRHRERPVNVFEAFPEVSLLEDHLKGALADALMQQGDNADAALERQKAAALDSQPHASAIPSVQP